MAQVDYGTTLLQQMQATMAALHEENATLRVQLAEREPARRLGALSGSAGGAEGASAPAAALFAPSLAPVSTSVDAGRLPSRAEQQEVIALRQELAQLRTSNELMRRSHETLIRDNQRLQAKLERLEQVFASSDASH